MTNHKPIILIGSRQDNLTLVSVAESQGRHVAGIVDRFYVGQDIQGIPVLGSDLDLMDPSSKLSQDKHSYDWFVNTQFTGITDTTNDDHNSFFLRNQRIAMAKHAQLNLCNIQHRDSWVMPSVCMGVNNLIGYNCCITAEVSMGSFNAFVYSVGFAHHCVVGDYCTFLGQIAVTANVKIGNNVFVGCNTTLSRLMKPTVIGDNVIIQSGSTVMRSIPDNTVYFNNGRRRSNQHFVMDSST
jgi:UDP-3-O-[3-hydroxymyristoyl] glucosamine N-acyltransferase